MNGTSQAPQAGNSSRLDYEVDGIVSDRSSLSDEMAEMCSKLPIYHIKKRSGKTPRVLSSIFTLRSMWLRFFKLSQAPVLYFFDAKIVRLQSNLIIEPLTWLVGTLKERLSERVTRKIAVSEPFRSEISPAYLMSLEVFHFFPSSDICSYKSRVSVQVNTWHWTLFSTFTKYPACSKTTHSIIHFYFPESIVYHSALLQTGYLRS